MNSKETKREDTQEEVTRGDPALFFLALAFTLAATAATLLPPLVSRWF